MLSALMLGLLLIRVLLESEVDTMKRTISIILTLIFCLTAFIGCAGTRHKRITDLEKSISKQWELLEDFEFIRITVDTIDGAEQEKCALNIQYSYTIDNSVVVKESSFEISYDDFLTLHNDNGSFVVYNNLIDDQYNALITDIKPASFAIIKNTIEWYWRTL